MHHYDFCFISVVSISIFFSYTLDLSRVLLFLLLLYERARIENQFSALNATLQKTCPIYNFFLLRHHRNNIEKKCYFICHLPTHLRYKND